MGLPALCVTEASRDALDESLAETEFAEDTVPGAVLAVVADLLGNTRALRLCVDDCGYYSRHAVVPGWPWPSRRLPMGLSPRAPRAGIVI